MLHGPVPEPESYNNLKRGPNPERPGEAAIGALIDSVPVTGLEVTLP
jgi:hypothetical protein